MQTATHPDTRTRMIITYSRPQTFTTRERLIVAMDSAALLIPLFGWLTENYWLALWYLNIAVPVVHLRALWTGAQAFREWQGRWKDFETFWRTALTTFGCFFMLVMLADHYAGKKWFNVGLFDNMIWSIIHYWLAVGALCYHRYVRKYG